MFRELMPILEGRALMLTLSCVDESVIRVCVVPKRLKDDSGENALCTPLTVTGTADELDREFAAQLTAYTSAVVKLGSNLAAIEAVHNAAVRTVEEEKKKDLDRKRGRVSGPKPTDSTAEPKPGPIVKDGKPVFGTKSGESAGTMTLFDAPPEGVAAVEPQSTPQVGAPSAEPVEIIGEGR